MRLEGSVLGSAGPRGGARSSSGIQVHMTAFVCGGHVCSRDTDARWLTEMPRAVLALFGGAGFWCGGSVARSLTYLCPM